MNSTLSAQQHSLEELARNFIPVNRPGVLLEGHHEAILILRARGATYAFIRNSLSDIGVEVSYSAVVRFCDKHHAELKRLRQSRNSPSSPSVAIVSKETPANSFVVGSAAKPIRDLRGPV
jgi:hypothetical protein